MGRRPPKRKKQRFTVIASALVILAVPLVLAGLVGLESADTRSSAGVGFETDLKCKIYFPYVDPNSLEVGKRATVEILADVRDNDASENFGDEWIKKISITAIESKEFGTDEFREVYNREFDTSNKISQASEQFLYQPQNIGGYSLSGEITTVNEQGIEGTHLCLLDRSYNQNILDAASTSNFGQRATLAQVVEENTAPQFTTELPAQNKNIIKVGDSYEHTLKAKDSDNDIQFDAAFTPDANWLKISNTQPTPNDVEIKFNGTADTPGSYLASVLIWDGWNGHTSSQSWVINVDQKENDIPKVTFTKPVKGTTVNQGEEIEISWQVEDLNHINKFQLYVAKNPSDESTWKPLNENLGFNTTNYILNTSALSAGDYYAIVKATDNQSPPATGTGSSEKFTVAGTTGSDDTPGPDDGPQKPGAGIVSISPADKSTVNTTQPLIKATLIASEGQSVVENSIKFYLNNEDLSSKIEIEPHSEAQVTISYKPEAELPDLSENKVKVTFEDSADNLGEREWTFKIELQPETNGKIWNIFGYEITAQRGIIAIIILIGLILLAIGIPWLIYILVRGPKDRGDDYSYYPNYTPPSTPTGVDTPFTSSSNDYYESDSTNSTPQTTSPTYNPSQSSSATNGTSYDTSSSYTSSTPTPAYDSNDSVSQQSTGASEGYTDTYNPQNSSPDYSSTPSASTNEYDESSTYTDNQQTSTSEDFQQSTDNVPSYTSAPDVEESTPEVSYGSNSDPNSQSASPSQPTTPPQNDNLNDQPSDEQVESIKKLAEQLKKEYSDDTSAESASGSAEGQDDSDSSGPYTAPPPTVLSND
ncbi:hypothetical protein GF357_01310 [Candidatus Dojkabacteria bacterium]|nr:hypothetical protein [Candidatus Dojkabacteria bacterium]